MPTTPGPLFSLAATGTIGDTLTYQHHTRAPIVRHKPTQAVPATTAQLQSRQTLAFLQSFWERSPFERDTYWKKAPHAKNLTPWTNLVHQANGPLIRGHNTQLFPYVPKRPGWTRAAGLTLSITGSTLHINCQQCPTPAGYTFFHAWAIIWDDLDPTAPGATWPPIRAASDTQFPMSVGISAGTHAKTKVVVVYGEFRDASLARWPSSPINGHIAYP